MQTPLFRRRSVRKGRHRQTFTPRENAAPAEGPVDVWPSGRRPIKSYIVNSV